MGLNTGEIIGGQFRILAKIGEGGMGAVYAAEQLSMSRKVVVKVMHPELARDSADSRQRFEREARAIARLNHPHIVQVYTSGELASGGSFLAMEYVEGQSLQELLDGQGALAERRALTLADQICDALIEAHQHGLIHRDLKPDNVLLCTTRQHAEHVKVLDFGIAKLLGSGDTQMTQTGAIFGTPRYMSPEQAQGLAVDPRSDIYALGVMLYHMLTGDLPFVADSAVALLVKHMSEPVVLPSARYQNCHLSPATEAILARCLAKSPADRFDDVAALRNAIADALTTADAPPLPTRGHALGTMPTAPTGGEQTQPDTDSGPAPPGRPASSKRAYVLVAAAVALLAVGVGVGSSWSDRAQTSESPGSPAASAQNSRVAEALPAARIEQGVPIPEGASLSARMPSASTYQTTLDPQTILAFYRHHLGEAWGPLIDYPNGLMTKHPESPISSVTVTKTAMGLMFSLQRNVLVASAGDAAPGAFGVPLPEGAKEVMFTPKNAVYQVALPVKEVVSYYRGLYDHGEGISVTETTLAPGEPYLLVNAAESTTHAFSTLAVMVTPDALSGGVKVSTQISIDARGKSP